MNRILRVLSGIVLALSFSLSLARSQAPPPAAPVPAIGDWDGVTASAHLAGPYEDPKQAYVPFGIISYFNMPWRSYMDTWPASQFSQSLGVNWNIATKYAEPVAQFMEESGIMAARVEVGWGNIGWDDDLNPGMKANLKTLLTILQNHHIRPQILLNAHHGAPCPMRDVRVEVVQPAQKGDRTLKLKDTKGVRPGYTGIPNPEYIAADPLITSVDPDGTVHLSAPLVQDVKVGPLNLQDLKYQPFQGVMLKDGTAVPEAQDSFDGWVKYAAAVGKTVREDLGTVGKPDAGFDVEVWNEQTFGSNFLNIKNYYDPPREYAKPFVYSKTRALTPTDRPDARTQFSQADCYAILPMTIDYFNDPANGFPGVNVFSGFANQWPWDNGVGLWDGQAGFSRHYYTGGWQDCTPEHPLGSVRSGTIDALGNFDGTKDNKDWHTILPGTNFVPTFRVGCPEFLHTGFKTESLSRDVIPDSRLSAFKDHGRYTNNGDFRTAQVWETEVNYDRSPFINDLVKQSGKPWEDPGVQAVDRRMAGKTLLRQYIFHASKGLYRIMIFCLGPDRSLGMLPQSFYTALDNSKDVLNDEARAQIPPEFKGLAWLKKAFGAGESLVAPRQLQVKDLVEYKPRLVFAGDGKPTHPSRWNRDEFAFLPYQLSESRFAIPYYVVTLDVTHVWDEKKALLDPARYDMPEQQYDVTIGNVRGEGAKVYAYDPLNNAEVPVKIVASGPASVTVRLLAVDYPRVLLLSETKPGPQIADPKVTVAKAGTLTVSWTTNLPAAAYVTYGRDWANRGANRVDVKQGETRLTVATGIDGVVAARIHVIADGLEDVWPRWDEDPQGQVVTPGATADTMKAPSAGPEAAPTGPSIPITMPAGIRLPVVEANAARGYSLSLPAGARLDGDPDDRQGLLGTGGLTVILRIRYLPGTGKAPDDYLPFTSTVDQVDRQDVSPTPAQKRILVTYHLAAVAHPGMTNVSQQYLLIPMGQNGGDLLLISAEGTESAMKAQAKTIQGVMASLAVR